MMFVADHSDPVFDTIILWDGNNRAILETPTHYSI